MRGEQVGEELRGEGGGGLRVRLLPVLPREQVQLEGIRAPVREGEGPGGPATAAWVCCCTVATAVATHQHPAEGSQCHQRRASSGTPRSGHPLTHMLDTRRQLRRDTVGCSNQRKRSHVSPHTASSARYSDTASARVLQAAQPGQGRACVCSPAAAASARCWQPGWIGSGLERSQTVGGWSSG